MKTRTEELDDALRVLLNNIDVPEGKEQCIFIKKVNHNNSTYGIRAWIIEEKQKL